MYAGRERVPENNADVFWRGLNNVTLYWVRRRGLCLCFRMKYSSRADTGSRQQTVRVSLVR